MLQAFMELRQIHSLFDDAEKWLVKELNCPICVKNCALCCMTNIITVHSIEASLIVSYLIGSGKLEAIDWARGWLTEKHSVAPTYEGMLYGTVSKSLLQEWEALSSMPCIFLTPDKQCSIHKMRPLSCRAYGVTRLPSRYCPRPLGVGESIGKKRYVGDKPGRLIRDSVNSFLSQLKERNPDWTKMGFLPTMIFRQAREREFRELIADNKIASAKLIGTADSTQSLWQSQVDALWQQETNKAKNLILA